MVNSLLHEWVGRLSVTVKTQNWSTSGEEQKTCLFARYPPRGRPPLSAPSHCRWRLPRGGFMGFVGGFMGQNVRSGGGLLCRGPWQERCTDARPGSKPRTTHPVHLWLIKCTEAGPGWSPVPARLDLCGTPLRTSLRHACDSFPARFQLVSSSFPARFQLSSKLSCFSSWKSVKHSLNCMNSAEFTEGSSG